MARIASMKRLRSSSVCADKALKAAAAASTASSTARHCPLTTRPAAVLLCPPPVSSLTTLRTMRSSSASLICRAIGVSYLLECRCSLRWGSRAAFRAIFAAIGGIFFAQEDANIDLGARDDIDGDDLADAARGSRTRVSGGIDGCHVARDDDRDQATADHFQPAHVNIGRFGHGVSRFDGGHVASGLDQAQRAARWNSAVFALTVIENLGYARVQAGDDMHRD